MKIAVFHNLPSGGAKRILHGFVKCIGEAGHSVDVFVPSTACEDFLPLESAARSVRVFPVNKTVVGRIGSYVRYIPSTEVSLWDLERVQREIAATIDDAGYEVVLTEQDRYTMSPFLLKYIKTPTVYFCQQPRRAGRAYKRPLAGNGKPSNGFSTPRSPRKVISDLFARRLPGIDRVNASYSRYILANSYFSRESILDSYGRNSFVSYLGVDTSCFRPLNINPEDLVVSVGMCVPGKGFDFVIESLGRIPATERPRFIAVANRVDEAWKRYLVSRASQLGVSFEIRVMIGDEELVSLYNRAKLLVYAPRLEPFGLVPLEAMACGTPVVGVCEGGVRESVVPGLTGLLTQRDEIEFAEAVSDLLNNTERRVEMGRRGVESVRQFWTLGHAADRLMEHLKRASEPGRRES